MKFKIEYDSQPVRFLKNQDKHLASRIIEKLENVLLVNPVPHNAKAIVGKHNCFRIRIGKCRALYRINYETSKIIIFKLDKRERVYD